MRDASCRTPPDAATIRKFRRTDAVPTLADTNGRAQALANAYGVRRLDAALGWQPRLPEGRCEPRLACESGAEAPHSIKPSEVRV